MAYAAPNDATRRIVEALGPAGNRCVALTLRAAVGDLVTLTAECFATKEELDGVAAVIESKEFALVRRDELPQWIAVADRLPECGDFVWAFTAEGVELAYWWNGFSNADGAGDREGLNSETLYPTHWMPIHEPASPEVK